MDEDELDRLRGLAQQHVGTICSGPIYPSEVLSLVEEIDRLVQVIVLMDRELEQAQAALIDGSQHAD